MADYTVINVFKFPVPKNRELTQNIHRVNSTDKSS